MHLVLGNVPNCNVYLDDVVVCSNDWADHVSTLRVLFQWLAEASLTFNLAKCEFGKVTVTYLVKEMLAMLLVLQYFEVYGCSGPCPLIVYTDHKSLVSWP